MVLAWHCYSGDKNEIQTSFGTLVLAWHCYSGDKNEIRTSFKLLFFQMKQEHGGGKDPEGNDELLWKAMSSSYHMEQKIQTSCSNNIHSGENAFCSCRFWRFVSCSFSESKKLAVYFDLCESFFFGFSENRKPNKYCL